MEERDAPDQIIIVAMDPDYCLLVALSVYLEYWMEHGDGLHSKYLFSDDVDDDAPKRTKGSVRSTLKKDVYVARNFNQRDRAQLVPTVSESSHQHMHVARVA